jgi:hypothetical protein
VISTELFDEIVAAMYSGDFDRVREIEQRSIPGARLAIYLINESGATVLRRGAAGAHRVLNQHLRLKWRRPNESKIVKLPAHSKDMLAPIVGKDQGWQSPR